MSCSKTKDAQEKEREDLLAYVVKNNITTAPNASGLYYIESLAGTGVQPKSGDIVFVHYTGTLLNGTKFDSSIGKQPFSFVLNAGQVIVGWDEGISLMKKGGKATLIIPSDLGYGGKQVYTIPAYSTLIFTVELVDVRVQ